MPRKNFTFAFMERAITFLRVDGFCIFVRNRHLHEPRGARARVAEIKTRLVHRIGERSCRLFARRNNLAF